MKPKNIYDATGDKVGTVKFLKNKNEYGFEFHEGNYYANTLVSVDGLEEYMRSFWFITEDELGQLRLEDLMK